MKLERDTNPGAYAVKVSCFVCGRMLHLADMTIDRDGPSFRAYFCPDDVPETDEQARAHYQRDRIERGKG